MKNEWREVKKEDGKYAIILRIEGYEPSVYFYTDIEDVKWAMKNSWFRNSEATPVKLLDWDIIIDITE